MIRVLRWTAIPITLSAAALTTYVARTWNRVWDVPMPAVHARNDAESIRRGEYLVYGPAHCVGCHAQSTSALEEYARTGVRPSLVGGMPFTVSPLGTIYSRNLTPDDDTGIGQYSDGQLARVLRYSVLPDGRASVRPLMQYAGMSDDDLAAVIAFLRSQPPVRHRVPDDDWTIIGKIVKSLSPAFKPRANVSAPRVAPAAEPTGERGEYLARAVGNCGGCHSPMNPITLRLTGPELSGGAPMEPRPLPGVDRTRWFQPPNLTSREGSAISRFPDRDVFVARFLRGGIKYPASPMPWECFTRMTASDVAALYEFLRSLPPAGLASSSDLVDTAHAR
jgi:mono/diheme cytochrome c family protein